MEKNKHKGYGAILGDIIGSPYEMNPIYTKNFKFFNKDEHFTDDTIMTIATMSKLLNNSNYTVEYKYWGMKHFGDYYGKLFKEWLHRPDFTSNDSFGNGAAMRVSPIGYAIYDVGYAQDEATLSAKSSHDNPQAIKAAKFIVSSIGALNEMKDKEEYERFCRAWYGLLFPWQLTRYDKFKVSCDYTVPQAARCFLDSDDIEGAIRNAVSIGGDCDTVASMAAELANAHRGGMDSKMAGYVEHMITPDMLYVLKAFNERF